MVHAAGQLAYHRLGLRLTGSVLMGLTVLLVPISFITWHLFVLGNWLAPDFVRIPHLISLLLLVGNTLFAILASDRIFRHFLKSRQTTFLVSYLILSLAGAVVPAVAAHGGIPLIVTVSIALWAVFSVGAIKVNRHVFWLVESHQTPRVYGFFPVFLLGGQFLGLFLTHFAGPVPTEWLGLGLAMFGVPVLLTADAVARVHQHRVAELVRRLPWSVAIPLALGILCCITGLVLAAQPCLFGQIPYALVPTALLCAVAMTCAAFRTKHQAFGWMMVVCVVLAYNFSPIFFQSAARQLVHSTASMVNESRFPFAFYGLTYLPLLIGFTLAAHATFKRGWSCFAIPLARASVVLPLLLMAAAFSEPSRGLYPVFLVGATMSGLFAWQTWLYRQRWLAIPAIASSLLAAASVSSFVNQVFQWNWSPFVSLTAFQQLATGLTLLGTRLDSRLTRLHTSQTNASHLQLFRAESICQSSGLLATVGATAAWLAMAFVVPASSMWVYGAAAAIGAALFLQCLRWPSNLLSGLFHALLSGIFAHVAIESRITWMDTARMLTVVWLLQWLADYALTRWDESRFSRAFHDVNRWTSAAGLLALLFAYYLPLHLTALMSSPDVDVPIMSVLLVPWLIGAGRRFHATLVGYVGYGFGMVLVTRVAMTLGLLADGVHWLPIIWAAVPIATLPAIRWLRKRQSSLTEEEAPTEIFRSQTSLLKIVTGPAVLLFMTLGVVSVVIPEWSYRLTGALCAGGLYALGALGGTVFQRRFAAAIITWHAIVAGVQIASHSNSLDVLMKAMLNSPGLLMATIASGFAVAWVAWDRVRPVEDFRTDEIGTVHRFIFRWGATGLILLQAFGTIVAASVGSWLEVVLTLFVLAVVMFQRHRAAVASRSVARAWSVLATIAIAICYVMAPLGIDSVALVVSIGMLLGFAIVEAVQRFFRSSATLDVYRTPLVQLSQTLPAVAAFLAAVSQENAVTPVQSLVMLFAAGAYFWKAVESTDQRELRLVNFSLSGLIVNIVVWINLSFHDLSDPIFYLIPTGLTVLLFVECLRRDLPVQLANALRYAGALCVLVSPSFRLLDDNWVHMLTLMIASVLIVLLSIGVRAKALLYVGTGFLTADLAAMVVRGCVDRPGALWIAGLAVGAAVVSLAALAENSREKLLQQMRLLSAQLETWT